MPTAHARMLLVEGKDDVYAVAGLMQHFVHWGTTREEWPVYIKAEGSAGELLAEGVISTYAKQSDLAVLGLMVDANSSAEGRWQRIRQCCSAVFRQLPQTMPPQGLTHEQAGLPRLGVWIMPDNRSAGMLETFLTYLVPDPQDALWEHAKQATQEAKRLGAPYKDNQGDKARIHAWLAWQAPPGDPLGEALKRKCLNPDSSCARGFVDWFMNLYGLRRLAQ